MKTLFLTILPKHLVWASMVILASSLVLAFDTSSLVEAVEFTMDDIDCSVKGNRYRLEITCSSDIDYLSPECESIHNNRADESISICGASFKRINVRKFTGSLGNAFDGNIVINLVNGKKGRFSTQRFLRVSYDEMMQLLQKTINKNG